MANKRVTAKERGLLKGAIRRVFSRSELRKQAMDRLEVLNHTNPDRPRVKTWLRCPVCGNPEAKSSFQVDHVSPVIPVDTTLEEMIDKHGWDELVNRIWCEPENLTAICETCHAVKTAAEKKLRKKPKRRSK